MDRRGLELESYFNFEPDSVRGGGWYTHHAQTVDNSFDRTYLDAPLKHDGRVYLRSNYNGDSWVFHDRIVVRAGNRVLESGRVPFSSSSNKRTSGRTGVWEELHFTAVSDGGILALIARDTTESIRVRYEGAERYVDAELEMRDKVAIAKTVELGRIIRLLGRRPQTLADAPLLTADARVGSAHPNARVYSPDVRSTAQRHLCFDVPRPPRAAGLVGGSHPGCAESSAVRPNPTEDDR